MSVVQGICGREYKVGHLENIVVPKVEGVPELLVQLASQRGIPDADLPGFFNPTIKEQMVDPLSLKDMEPAAKLLAEAIISGKKIGMVGDYDVDGATSVAIMGTLFHDLGMVNGVDFQFYIPQRLQEGYGASVLSVQRLVNDGCSVLLFLDSGTIAYPAIEKANELNVPVVVVDHHEPGPRWIDNKPKAAIVNPKRPDDEAGVPYLCTAGLAILLCVQINRYLVSEHGVAKESIPDVMEYMGLAALGTVADLMQLRGLNRAYVRAGLARMHLLPGVAGLAMAAMGVTDPNDFPRLSAKDLGFAMGPAVNAAGRIDDCFMGANALLSLDLDAAIKAGKELVSINVARREMQDEIEKTALEEAEAMVQDGKHGKCLVVANDSWHPGIIGIVAGRLKETYNMPAIVIGANGKGSGRSAHDFNLGESFIEATEKGLLIGGGGHAAAGGLTISPERLDEFREFMAEKSKDITPKPERVDGVLPVDMITSTFVREMECLEPFGMGNPAPVWLLKNIVLTKTKWVGRKEKKHLSITFQSGQSRLNGIVFSAKGTPLEKLEEMVGETISLIVQVSRNSRSAPGFSDIEIKVKDAVLE